MPFPLDPNAPGGPRRSAYLRSSFAAPASATDERLEPEVSVRLSTLDGGDRESLRRLASLNDSPPPSGPVVLAEVDSDPVAALSLSDGDTVADPSRSSSSIIALLHLHYLEARVIGAIWGA
jgi:hypothetical protein